MADDKFYGEKMSEAEIDLWLTNTRSAFQTMIDGPPGYGRALARVGLPMFGYIRLLRERLAKAEGGKC